MWCQNIRSVLFSFVTIHACADRQTELRLPDRPRTCSRGKNATRVTKYTHSWVVCLWLKYNVLLIRPIIAFVRTYLFAISSATDACGRLEPVDDLSYRVQHQDTVCLTGKLAVVMTWCRYVLFEHHADVFVVGRLHCSRPQLSLSLAGDARHASLGETLYRCRPISSTISTFCCLKGLTVNIPQRP